MPKSCKDPMDIKLPMDLVKQIINTLNKEDIIELYEISDFKDDKEFLNIIAKKYKYKIKVIVV